MQYERRVKFDRLYKTHTTLGMDPGIFPPSLYIALINFVFSVFKCLFLYLLHFCYDFLKLFSAALMLLSS